MLLVQDGDRAGRGLQGGERIGEVVGNRDRVGQRIRLLGQQYRSLFEQTYASTTRDAIDAYKSYSSALSGITLTTAFPSGNSVGSSLAQIAKTIAARGKLGVRRQVFFVSLGGFDLHDNLLTGQPGLLKTISQGVGAFWSALGEIGMQDQVTLFSASDFARTLTSNGDGSDHAWGGNHFVLGGAVQGGQVFGDKSAGYYPDLQKLSTMDTGSGRLIPGVAVDEYARDMLAWFGVSATDMDYVLPAYSSRFAGRNPLGIYAASASSTPTTPTSTTPPSTTTGGTSSSAGSSSGGGGGGGAVSPIFLGALGAAALVRLRQKRMKAKQAEKGS